MHEMFENTKMDSLHKIAKFRSFSQNYHTWKSGEISVFYAVIDVDIHIVWFSRYYYELVDTNTIAGKFFRDSFISKN